MSNDRALSNDGLGQRGHENASSHPVLDSEVKSAHTKAAELSERHEADAKDKADAEKPGQYTSRAEDLRGEVNSEQATKRADQENASGGAK